MLNKKLIVIHGVNYFDEKQVRVDVIAAATNWGVAQANITLFNWDILMGYPLAPTPDSSMNTRFVAELGAGMLNAAHLGFFSHTLRANSVPSKLATMHTAFVIPFQMISLLILPSFIGACAFSKGKVWLATYFSLFIALTCIGLSNLSLEVFRQCFRRSVLIAVWGLTSNCLALLLVPGIAFWLLLPGLLIALMKLHPYLVSRGYRSGTLGWLPTSSGPLLTGLIVPGSIMVVFLLMQALVALLRISPLGAGIKVTADTCRYIGLSGYRQELLAHLDRLVESHLQGEPDEIIFLTHSLGSVIVTDYLLQTTHQRLPFGYTVITMGSPLRRLFPTFYPTEYRPPSATLSMLCRRLSGFRWINIYRRFDPIGGALGSRDVAIVDIGLIGPTQNKGRFTRLPAHQGYWSEINTTLEAALKNSPMSEVALNEVVETVAGGLSVDPYSYGWSQPNALVSKLWLSRKVIGRPADKKANVSQVVVVSIAIYLLLALSMSVTLHPLQLRLAYWTEYILVAEFGVLLIPAIWLTAIQPYLNFVFACFPYFKSPLLGAEDRSQRAFSDRMLKTERHQLKQALPFILSMTFLITLLGWIEWLPVSFWGARGFFKVDSRMAPWFYSTVAIVDDHNAISGQYNNPIFYRGGYNNLEWSASQFKADADTGIVSYDPASGCVGVSGPVAPDSRAVFTPRKIWYGALSAFPANPKQAHITESSGALLSIGSDCHTATLATSSSLVSIETATSEVMAKWDLNKLVRGALYAVVSPNGSKALLCSYRGRAIVIDVRSGVASDLGRCERLSLGSDMSFSPSGDFAIWLDGFSSVAIVELASMKVQQLNAVVRPNDVVRCVAIGSGGKAIAIATSLEIRILDTISGSVLAHRATGTELVRPTKLAFSDNGRLLGVADMYFGELRLFAWKKQGFRQRVMEALVHIGLKGKETAE